MYIYWLLSMKGKGKRRKRRRKRKKRGERGGDAHLETRTREMSEGSDEERVDGEFPDGEQQQLDGQQADEDVEEGVLGEVLGECLDDGESEEDRDAQPDQRRGHCSRFWHVDVVVVIVVDDE
jgi:hypothetical protein